MRAIYFKGEREAVGNSQVEEVASRFDESQSIFSNLFFFMICIAPFLLSCQARIQIGGLQIALIEISYPFLLAAWVGGMLYSAKRLAFATILSWLILFLTSIVGILRYTDNTIFISHWRNIVIPVSILFMILSIGISNQWFYRITRCICWAGFCVAVLGILQFTFGYSRTIQLLDIDAQRDSRLLDIMGWKSNGFLGYSQDLAVGLFEYSNVFASYLVSGSAALVFIWLRARRSQRIWYALMLLIYLIAICMSLSRTGIVGFFLVLIVSWLLSKTFQRHGSVDILRAFVIVPLIGFIIIVSSMLSDIDGGGTIQGRETFNWNAIKEVFSSFTTLIFGGNYEEYRNYNAQDPHNVLIYTALVFGVTFSTALAFIVITPLSELLLSRWPSSVNNLRIYAVTSSMWLIANGFTWSLGLVEWSMYALTFGSAYALLTECEYSIGT